jgi:hypothetical protein
MQDVSGNIVRTWKTPRGQFLDHPDVHTKVQQIAQGGMAGTEKRFASNEVARNILELLVGEISDASGIHAETVLATLGALAGFGVPMGIREDFIKSGKIAKEAAFTTVTTKDGSTYYFGDLLNEGLVASRPGNYSVWTLVGGAAQRLGAKSLPDLKDLFSHVSRSVGGKEFGVPRLPLRNIQWSLILAFAAQLFMVNEAKDIIEPGLAARVVMEAAVPMSKEDPRRVHAAFIWSTDDR